MAGPFTWNLTAPADNSLENQFPALDRQDKTTLANLLGPLAPFGTATQGWRVLQVNDVMSLASNVYYDGTNYQRDNTGQASFLIRYNVNGSIDWIYVAPGANPIGTSLPSPILSLSAAGVLSIVGGANPSADNAISLGAAAARFASGFFANKLFAGGDTTVGTTLQKPTSQLFTSGSGTYTLPANARAILVFAKGGGGGGGGCAANNGSGGGGGEGGYGLWFQNSPSASSAYAVGAGGAGGAAGPNPGSAGGNTTFGPLTAGGGAGGPASGGNSPGGVGGTASGGTTNEPGMPGGAAIVGVATNSGVGGNGGGRGGGVGGGPGMAGANAASGSGGGGGGAGAGNVASAGGNGAPGFILVIEFY